MFYLIQIHFVSAYFEFLTFEFKKKIQNIKDMEEGFSSNKPPLFKGIKYDYWKERMIAHFESIHIDLWDVVENEDYIP